MANRFPLVIALLVSVIVHGVLVVLMPGMSLPELLAEKEELLEFEVREPQEPLPLEPPEPETLKQPEEVAQPEESAEPPDNEAPEQAMPVEQLDDVKLANTLRSELPALPVRPHKAVWLPTRRAQKVTAETIMISQPRQSVEPAPGDDALKRVDAAPIARSADMSAAKAAAKNLLASLGGLPSKVEAQPKEPVKNQKAPGTPEIGGEVGVKRTVVRHPPPPTVQIDNPVTVEMEFWVSPVGDVIRAHALRTGEADLDRAAAQYVKGFKFNALDTGEIGLQRGTILVRFSWK